MSVIVYRFALNVKHYLLVDRADLLLIGVTVAVVATVPQNLAQSRIKRVRFSNRSPRRYAASTLSAMV
jgi:hypothetical protein